MTQTDDRILELLDESDLILSPGILAVNLDYSRSWVSQRIKKLVDADLIRKVDGGHYEITDRGRAYLEGEIDAEELEDLE